MKKLFSIFAFLLSFTLVNAQLPTDLRDWTISGTRTIPTINGPVHDTVHNTQPGFSNWPKNNSFGVFEFTSVTWYDVTASKTYTTSDKYDSLVVVFTITPFNAGSQYNFNGSLVTSTTKTKRYVNSDTDGVSDISILFSMSAESGSKLTVSGVEITGYVTNTTTGVTSSYNMTTGSTSTTQTTPIATSINESVANGKTNVWSNTNKMYVKNEDNKNLTLNVFNLSGQLILTKNEVSDVTECNFESGIYMIQLVENTNVLLSKKVVITN